MHDYTLSMVHLQNGELLNHNKKSEDSRYNSVWTRFTVSEHSKVLSSMQSRPRVGHTLPKDSQETGNMSCHMEGQRGGLAIFH